MIHLSFKKLAFFLLIAFCLSPFSSPPVSLILGLVFALAVGNPYSEKVVKPARHLLQASVALLGFGMNLSEIHKAGREGFLFTVTTIFGTLLLGFLIGELLKLRRKTSALISAGTTD